MHHPSPARPLLCLALTLAACGPSASSGDGVPTTQPHASASKTAPSLAGDHVQSFHAQAEVEPEPESEPRLAWTLVETTAAETSFAPLERGLLMNVGEERFTLVEGELAPAPARAKTKHAIVGSWPGNAWTVRMRSEERAGLYIRMSKWKGDRRWVSQPIKDAPEEMVWADGGKWYEIDTDFWNHVGGRGGYLMGLYDYDEERIIFRRLAGENFAPVDLAWDEAEDGRVRELYETPSGRLLVFVEGKDGQLEVVERPRCRQACTQERVVLSAEFEDKPLGEYVARGEDLVSLGVRASWNADASTQLLHRDAKGWSLEDMPVEQGELRRMVAGSEGALFAVFGFPAGKDAEDEQLWHRDGEGQWQALELPEALTAPERAEGIALDLDLARVDEQQIWVAANAGEAHAVYALPIDPPRPR